MDRSRQNSLLLAVTSPVSWLFYRGVIGHLKGAGFDPILLSSPGAKLQGASTEQGVPSIGVPMEREIAPLRDLAALWNLYRAIRKTRPEIVDASTPKAGLLVAITARLAGVPTCIYSLRGLRLETAAGPKRYILWLAEWITC